MILHPRACRVPLSPPRKIRWAPWRTRIWRRVDTVSLLSRWATLDKARARVKVGLKAWPIRISMKLRWLMKMMMSKLLARRRALKRGHQISQLCKTLLWVTERSLRAPEAFNGRSSSRSQGKRRHLQPLNHLPKKRLRKILPSSTSQRIMMPRLTKCKT